MNPHIQHSNAGFTLIESIIAIVILGFIAAMMTAYFSVGITRSHDPIGRFNAGTGLNVILANITAQYRQIPHNWKPDTHYTVNTIILPTAANHNGFQYLATSASGTSDTIEPSWPLTAGTSTTDNTVTWKNNGSSSSLPTLQSLQTSIGTEGSDVNNAFGNYHVERNRFIKFDAGNQETNIDSTPTDPAYGHFLEVTIGFAASTSNRTSETLTTLFALY